MKFWISYLIFYFFVLAALLFIADRYLDMDNPCLAYNLNKKHGYFNIMDRRTVSNKLPIYCESRANELVYIGEPKRGGHWVEKD